MVGPGRHDDSVPEGVIASGEATKEAESEEALRDAFYTDVRKVFPERSYAGTFDIERTYDLAITADDGAK